MKIGIFTNAYHPIVSGVVNAIDCIEKGLTDLGHQVYIIAPHYPKFQDDNPKIIRFPSMRLTWKADFPLPIPYVPSLIKKIENLNLDVIHAQHPFLLGVLGQKIAAKQNIPFVFTFHTLYEDYIHYAPSILPSRFFRWWVHQKLSTFIKKADAVIVPSKAILTLVKEYNGGNRSHLIPNAIQLEPFQSASGDLIRKEYQLQGKKVMMFVGRLAQEKNLSFLIRAFGKIHDAIPETVLILAGDGPYRKTIEEETSKQNLKTSVIFTGMIPYKEIPNYLKASQLFVTASTTEVKPLSLLEAMASGLPILAVDAPWSRDTIHDGFDGCLERENEEEFAAAAIGLLQNETKLEEMSHNADKTAESFGIPAMAEKMEMLYKNLISMAGR